MTIDPVKKIKVLIADDSKLICTLLNSIFSKAPDFEVLGFANTGEEAVKLTKALKPDIVSMDIMMPKLDGYGATKQIMAECPTPIVILSSLIHEAEIDSACKTLAVGALEALPKFFDVSKDEFESKERHFLNTMRALSEVRVIRRRQIKPITLSEKVGVMPNQDIKILAIGISTGGPEALSHIFSTLKVSFPVPIVVVLHISKGFLIGLVKWLQRVTALEVCIAENGTQLLPGKVYFAPDDCHLQIKAGEKPIAFLNDGTADDRLKPAVDVLFHSLAKAYP
ncbi:MAG: chemotaxis protein CheB, partial [Legionella sp.]|nr:chemotaxis protein CheB [Legionella sp.]